jgi:RNA 2',3'-cyclic 3'-phosphodiesterase
MFVALDLPSAARDELAEWRDELVEGRAELRPVRAEYLHVTLAFLGWQDEAAAQRIADAAFAATAGLPAPWLTPAAVRALPPRGPRLFALELLDRDGRCAALAGAVGAALAELGVYRPEKRPFWPHLTLARVKRSARAGPLPDLPAPLVDGFEARRLTLYRSTLRPQGSIYDPLASSSL